MIKNFTKLMMSLALVFGCASTAQAEDWYVSGTFNNYENAGMREVSAEQYELYVAELKNAFYIHTENDTQSYGGTNPVVLGAEYTLVDKGNDLMFEAGISYVKDAVITFNPQTAVMTVTGTAVSGGGDLSNIYVAGSFNDWSLTDPSAVLSREPGSQIFFGRVQMGSEDTGNVTWRLYTSQESLQEGSWGLPFESTVPDQTEGILQEGSVFAVSTAAGTYDFSFNMANGSFKLTKVKNTSEKGMIITPDPAIVHNKYMEFSIIYGGYNTATLDPAMYDVMNGPGTFTNVSTGEVVSKVGGQPLPQTSNEVVLQLSQTIYSQDFLNSVQIEPGEEDYYKAYPDGAYMLSVPQGMITLDDGITPVPNEPIEVLFTLGVEGTTGVNTIAPEFRGMNVYTLDGVFKARVESAADLNALPKGIYIVKGRKIAVR